MELRKNKYLLVIKTPGNIEKEILKIQYKIFRQYQNISSIILDPIIPLKFFNSKPTLKDLDNYKNIKNFDFFLKDFNIIDSFLYLKVESEYFTNINFKETRNDIFPCSNGFFAGKIPDDFKNFSFDKLKWKKSSLSLLDIKWINDPFNEDIYVEEIPITFSNKAQYNQISNS